MVTASGHTINFEPPLGVVEPLSATRSTLEHAAVQLQSASDLGLTFEGLTFAEIERIAIEQAIGRADGNVTKAARNLAANPSTIYRKLERWT